MTETVASASPQQHESAQEPALSNRQRKKQQRAQEKRQAAPTKRPKRDHPKPTPVVEYSIVNGYRLVKPYVYEFRTHAKERWYGRELLAIFTAEFGANSPDYYRFAIQSGRITVNERIVGPDTVINNGDLIVHKTHRHEPPVSGEEIPIVHEDDDLLVVCKPPSITTHPSGAYRYNSLHLILQHMRPDLPPLHIVHRLDRLTSGIVLLAKNAAKAKELSLCIAERQASKTYLARARGCFPTALTPNAKLQLAQTAQAKCPASSVTFTDADELVISCPLRCVSAREGVYECHAEGKPSETVVSLVRNGSATCVFKCKPVTGRTHQIRLHLQLIGFPIANDPCYGGQLHFGESQARLDEIALATRAKEQLPPKRDGDYSRPQEDGETEDEFMQRTCSWCYVGADEAFNETQLHCSKIWLHALEYELDGQVFTAPEPSWAAPSEAY
ncbi:hypothetical protein PybrP1_012673 [[Pythium] brassicae (nom. inval.)]|nr:hypothetical protein PybrP1_012673 [[Pythium] brassicae (nom. inval.)]